MLISVVTGTFNRLSALSAMITSARRAAVCLKIEFVIVDGGSTDGTLDYLRAQSDVKLIEHGELRGAIKAFCEGARAAKGDYVILANDDVQFHEQSILRAFVHLESTSTVGAVAFMDNRPIVEGGSTDYKAQMQVALDPNGNGCSVPYAQVGMFRRWLGDMCGWWGIDDPIMSQARTYGGDNYLSSRIWEHGYTVDVVKGAIVHDYILLDALRDYNRQFSDSAYYQLYPRGPKIASAPAVANPQGEALRILYLPIFEPGNPRQKQTKRGLYEALARIGVVHQVDYLNEKYDLPMLVDMLRPHVMLTQMHDAVSLPASTLAACRTVNPSMLILNWNGDARGLTEQPYIDLLKHVDLQLVVNAAPLDEYARHGIRAAYWQIGIEEYGQSVPHVQSHDVLFLGNCYNAARRDLESTLLNAGFEVGFYGLNWQHAAGECLYDFATGAALYQNAKVSISDTFYDGKTEVKAFVSNRLFQALAAGAFVLQQHSPDLERFTGLVAGVHYVEWTRPDDLVEQVRAYLRNPKDRARIARAGQSFVLQNYSFDRQVKRLFEEILPMLEGEYAATV